MHEFQKSVASQADLDNIFLSQQFNVPLSTVSFHEYERPDAAYLNMVRNFRRSTQVMRPPDIPTQYEQLIVAVGLFKKMGIIFPVFLTSEEPDFGRDPLKRRVVANMPAYLPMSNDAFLVLSEHPYLRLYGRKSGHVPLGWSLAETSLQLGGRTKGNILKRMRSKFMESVRSQQGVKKVPSTKDAHKDGAYLMKLFMTYLGTNTIELSVINESGANFSIVQAENGIVRVSLPVEKYDQGAVIAGFPVVGIEFVPIIEKVRPEGTEESINVHGNARFLLDPSYTPPSAISKT